MSRTQAESSCSFEDFTDMLYKILHESWGENWGTFCEAFPNGTDPTDVEFPIITYALSKKVPGEFGKGVKEIKPRFREMFRVPDAADENAEVINVYSQIFDYTVIFEVWEENNAKLNKLANQFEDLITICTGYLMSRGVNQLIFLEMTGANGSTLKESATCRKFTYLVRLEKQVAIPSAVIKEVIGKVELRSTMSGDQDHYTEAIDFKFNRGGNF
jgi:hypothetical protein